MGFPAIEVSVVDPCSPPALRLSAALSDELARRYDHEDDGSGGFKAEAGEAVPPWGVFVIGSLAGVPVACGAFRRLEGDVAEIKRMYVVPEHRGRGYARVILRELERLAADSGYSAAQLETGDRQPEAIGLYERAGYHRIPPYGYYTDSPRSVCFEKRWAEEAR
jgi:GNAT superfamily N-acetyltransferase